MYCFIIKKLKQVRKRGRRHVLEWWLIVNSMALSKKIGFFMNTAEPLLPYMSVNAVGSVATIWQKDYAAISSSLVDLHNGCTIKE
jgi:hypothetical protein